MAAQLQRNEFEIYFDTRRPLPAEIVGEFLAEVGRLGRLKRNFGPDVLIVIEDVEVGSLRLRLRTILVAAAAMALAADTIDVGKFVAEIFSQAEKPDSKLGRCISTMVKEHGVEELVVRTCDTVDTRSGQALLAVHQNSVEAYLPRNEEAPHDNWKHSLDMLAERESLETAVQTGKRLKLAGRFHGTPTALRFTTMSGGTYRVPTISSFPLDLLLGRPTMIVAGTRLIGTELVLVVHEVNELDDL